MNSQEKRLSMKLHKPAAYHNSKSSIKNKTTRIYLI